MELRRGDIIWVEFRSGNGHVQRGRRPCVVVSTNRINCHSGIINVIPGTTNLNRRDNPVHLTVKNSDICGFMGKDTMFLTEQLTSIDTEQILGKTGYLSKEMIKCLDEMILKQLGIKENKNVHTK